MSEIANHSLSSLATRFAWPTQQRAPWGFWGTTAWGLAAIGLYIVAFVLTYRAVIGWQGRPGLEPTLATIVGGLIELGVIAVAIRYTGLPWRDYLGLRRPERIDLLLGLACLLLVFGAYAVMDHVLGNSSPLRGSAEKFRILQANGMLLPFVFAGAVVAPIAEEALFRGFLYRGWNSSILGIAGTILLTSLLWAALHMKPSQPETLIVLVVGLLLGSVRWLSGSTTLVIGIHMTHNLFVVAWSVMAARLPL